MLLWAGAMPVSPRKNPCKFPASRASLRESRLVSSWTSTGGSELRTTAVPALVWTAAELSDPERRLSLEWLETDGLGGFASGTVAGARTRREHGWYVPAIPPPRRRWMFVAGCEEFVTAGGVETGISSQIYRTATHPDGDRHLIRFALDPFPTWRYEGEGFQIERTIGLLRERSVTVVRYRNTGPTEVALSVRPLLRCRSSRELRAESDEIDTSVEVRGEVSWVRPAAYLPRLYLRAVGAETTKDPTWYRDFYYRVDAERGEEATEDLWSPLRWR